MSGVVSLIYYRVFPAALCVPDALLKRYQLVQLGCQEMNGRPFRDVLISPQGYRFSEVEQGFIQRVMDVRDELNKQYGPLPWS